MRKFFIKLITNFQPRMKLGPKRFNEEANRGNKLFQKERERLVGDKEREYVSERTIPADEKITGPSDSKTA